MKEDRKQQEMQNGNEMCVKEAGAMNDGQLGTSEKKEILGSIVQLGKEKKIREKKNLAIGKAVEQCTKDCAIGHLPLCAGSQWLPITAASSV